MRILITGGGSAGHITPLVAIAAEIKRRHPQAVIRYIGHHGDTMQTIIASELAIDKCYAISAGKWRRYNGLGFWQQVRDFKAIIKNLRDVVLFALGFLQSLVIMIFWRPNVVFVKGGFVGLPVGWAAALLRVPIVTHDSDAVPGLTNRLLARFAKAIAVGMPLSAYKSFYPEQKLHFTGVPVRPEFFTKTTDKQISARQTLKLRPSDQVICVIGGSLGAVRLNNVIISCLEQLLADSRRQLIWITGAHQHDTIIQQLKKSKIDASRLHVFSFIVDVQEYLALSDVVISRAGATAIAELAALAKPIILVPNPLLTNAHQLKNATLLELEQAAVVVQESVLQKESGALIEAVNKIMADVNYRQRLGQNLHRLAVADATKKIVDVIEGVR
jgi:UDP-N-acetylglucosamine--N-acetylmuramyl-(pentapeptide) pyrophosphoryl-undecaprenol N-acetylglucosamine transferase